MNSVKNAIVTMTLLAVGYGAYVVLTNPVPEDLGELADGTVWEAPEVMAPGTDLGSDASMVSIDEPPPLATTGDHYEVAGTETSLAPNGDVTTHDSNPYGLQAGDPMEMPETSTPYGANSYDTNSTADELSMSAPSGTIAPPMSDFPESGTHGSGTHGSGTHGSGTRGSSVSAADPAAQDPNANFYVSRSDSPADAGTYPTTGAPGMPLADVSLNNPTAGANGASVASGVSSAGFDHAWQAAQADLQSGQLGAALSALSMWHDEPSLTSQQRDTLLPLLDQLAGTVIYSRDSFLEPTHVVQQGETLQQLAAQYRVPIDFLARINGIESPYELFPGESIKVVQGPFRAEVSRARNQLTLFLGRHYAGRFQTRVGPELPSGENTYNVVSIDPGLEYFDAKTGNRIARDDPSNPYGSLWISLRGNQITAAHNVGIHIDHGDPQRCCLGVSAADANDLSVILGPGSTVQVKP